MLRAPAYPTNSPARASGRTFRVRPINQERGSSSSLNGYRIAVTRIRGASSPVAAEFRVCPDGPILVRGPFAIFGEDGAPIDARRRVLALCRCGRSKLAPMCDGSHRRRLQGNASGTPASVDEAAPAAPPALQDRA